MTARRLCHGFVGHIPITLGTWPTLDKCSGRPVQAPARDAEQAREQTMPTTSPSWRRSPKANASPDRCSMAVTALSPIRCRPRAAPRRPHRRGSPLRHRRPAAPGGRVRLRSPHRAPLRPRRPPRRRTRGPGRTPEASRSREFCPSRWLALRLVSLPRLRPRRTRRWPRGALPTAIHDAASGDRPRPLAGQFTMSSSTAWITMVRDGTGRRSGPATRSSW